jgi:hypothetical protein
MMGPIGIASRLIFAAVVLVAGLCPVAHAERRVALVIGNSSYRTVATLPNPAADARLISDTLLSLGFFVVGGSARLDLDKAGFDAALQEFSTDLVGADVALFYYAGHGLETHGLNYLVPVDAHPLDEADVFAQMIGTSDILDRLEKSGTRINLVLLDACRDNPFRDRGVRSTTGGLAQMPAPIGTLISFATQPRSVSLDGGGDHSPIQARWPRQCSGPASVFSRLSTKSGSRWRRRPAASNCLGCRLPRYRAISISPPSPDARPTAPGKRRRWVTLRPVKICRECESDVNDAVPSRDRIRLDLRKVQCGYSFHC